MVKTRRSVNGEIHDRNYIDRTLSKVGVDQDETADGWPRRELRSRYCVTTKHWPAKLVRGRLRTIKMPRIMYPESEDTEPEKFSRRGRPVRVFFSDGQRVRRVGRPRRSPAPSRKLRPLQPNNYMEDSDKACGLQQAECHVRRSGRQRKLLHHSFNESWITNELKVKGYPRLFGRHRRSSSSSDISTYDERSSAKPITKQLNGPSHNEDTAANKSIEKRMYSTRLTNTMKKPLITDDEDPRTEEPCENGDANLESDKDLKQENEDDEKTEKQEDLSDTGKNAIGETQTSTCRNLRLRRGRSGDASGNRETTSTSHRRGRPKKEDNATNSQTGSESDNSSDSGSEIAVVRRQLRSSNRKPRKTYISSPNRQGKARNYTMRNTYSLRERKQPKIIVRSQSPTTSSSSSSSDEELNVTVKNKTKARQKSKTLGEHHSDRALKEIQPIELDGTIRFTSVGGLESHITCLREMVLFPLMYRQIFDRFGSHPPKGVLFHGPPGTGKTLLARALANECSLQGGQKVAFFMRKGADCLKKWVGESERNIKLLFQQATKMKPSIIFFDEIDALAPVRSVRQEQVHTSVVGTLLAEMDGLCDRGEVVVIGATNRLDAVDPALRRAGRFDRELHFPPPAASQRASILKVLTGHWQPPPHPATIEHIAEITSGYGGSDLKALCSEAVLRALERTYPQVYKSQQPLLIDPQNVDVLREDLVRAMKGLVAAGSRCAPPPARTLPPHLAPLLASNMETAMATLRKTYPFTDNIKNTSASSSNIPGLQSLHSSSVLLLNGPCSSQLVAPALLATLEHCAVREISLAQLHQSVYLTQEQSLLSILSEVRRCAQGDNGCVVYIPCIELLWPLLGDSGGVLLLQQWQDLSHSPNCLLLATCHCDYDHLPDRVKLLFPSYRECVYNMKPPTLTEITNFLKPLFLEKPLIPLPDPTVHKLPELPIAPVAPPRQPTAEELRKQTRREAHLLRELRIFLRDVCRKLAANRRFYKFTKPVDLEEVTDYLDIVSQPMDLETMMTKVDMHKYNCARDFLLDIDLICANALEYNPDRTSSDKQIRHEACSLRDHAHALVEVEMDSDFEEECRAIANRRAGEGVKHDQDVPSFIYTATHLGSSLNVQEGVAGDQDVSLAADTSRAATTAANSSLLNSAAKRRRKKKGSLWSKGNLAKKPKTSLTNKDTNNPVAVTDEESKENKPLGASDKEDSLSSSMDNHDIISSPDKAKSPAFSGRSGGEVEHAQHRDLTNGTVRQLKLDDAEMLLDANAMDGITSSNKASECHDRPDQQRLRYSGESAKSNNKKKTKQDFSHKGGASKLVVDRGELEGALAEASKSLRHVGLQQLVDLHSQLDRILLLHSSQQDRTQLPKELLGAVNRFRAGLNAK